MTAEVPGNKTRAEKSPKNLKALIIGSLAGVFPEPKAFASPSRVDESNITTTTSLGDNDHHVGSEIYPAIC